MDLMKFQKIHGYRTNLMKKSLNLFYLSHKELIILTRTFLITHFFTLHFMFLTIVDVLKTAS